MSGRQFLPVVFQTASLSLRGSVVKSLNRNPEVLGLSHTPSSFFFFFLGGGGSLLGQDTSEPKPCTSETQERHEQRALSPWYD